MNFIEIFLNFLSYIFWFVFVMIPLVTIHEFGHFIVARIFGVNVPEFGIGVPPRAFAKRWKSILWSLNWIPLGAFVRIDGDGDSMEKASRNLEKGDKNTKKTYIEERTFEILSLGMIGSLLEKNHIENTPEWQDFAKKYDKKDYQLTLAYKDYSKQLETFIAWEYESYFEDKSKKDFNTLYFTKPLYQRILILVGGVTFNILGAFVIFVIALNSTGLIARNTFDSNGIIDYKALVQDKNINNSNLDSRSLVIVKGKDYPAEQAGISNNSELVSINDFPAKNLDNAKIQAIVAQSENTDVAIRYIEKIEGKTEEKLKYLTPKVIEGQRKIGISLTNSVNYKSQNFLTSIKDASDHTIYYTKLSTDLTFKFFTDLINPKTSQKAIDQTSGPIGISYISKNLFDSFGLASVLWLMALISISLAIFNLLPVPALDGGRILLSILERIFGQKIKKIEPYLVGSTYIILLILMFGIIGKDIIMIWNITRK